MAIKYPDRIESNNPQAYGIIKATEIAGQRQVKQLSDLYKLSDAILSESKTGEDAEGQIWIVGKDQYQLISWQNRNNASGWQKIIPFDEKMFDRFYNLDGNMINALTGYTKATELLSLLENDSLLNALGKLEYKADLTYNLVNSVYEGVHTIEELREMLKVLEGIQNSSEILNSYLSNYLPLAGGTMRGNLNMGGKYITNGQMYETSLLWGDGHYHPKRVIDTLLTQPGNRLACTPASHIDVEYSRDNGETWLDYGLTDAQKTNIFTLDNKNNVIYLGKRYNDGAVDITKDRLRITWWSYKNGKISFYGTLAKFLIKTSITAAGQVINTKISKLTIGDYNNIDNWTTLSNTSNVGWPVERSYNYAAQINTSNGNTGDSWDTLTIALRFEFSYDSTSSQQPTTTGAYLYYIKGFGSTIHNHAVGIYGLPFNNQPFTYDSYQNTTFPAKVTSQEPINYDAVIKPTQSGNTVTKTNNWVLQYLTQGVHWLRDNKVETNSDATLRTLNIRGNANSTVLIESDAISLITRLGGRGSDAQFVIKPDAIRPGSTITNTIELGNTDSYWKSVRAGKYIVHGGTSSQFLKADGSVDSNSYATLDSTGKVEKSILADDLGGREETREEQFTYQATANDESVKDGLAIVKSIKGNTVVANQLFKKNLHNPISGISVTYDNSKFTVNGIIPSTDVVYLDQDYTQYKQGDKILILYPHNKPNPHGTFVILSDRQFNNYYRVRNDTDKVIFTIKTTGDLRPIFPCVKEQPYEDIQFSLKIINLTQMFGAGNEPSTAEEFERLYPNLPKEYNEGSLLNFNADSIKSVGFNAFNGEYAKVLGGMQYYLGGNITSLVFKENLEDEGEVIEIPSDNLYTPATNGYLVATGSDICINLSHSGYRDGEYEPYKESIVNLPIKKYFPDGMKSAGEVRDEIVWDESIEKYKAIQRIGSVDMGTLDWEKSNSVSGIFGVHFGTNLDEIYKALNNIICQDYLIVTAQEKLLNTNKSIINSWYYYRGLNVHDDEAWNSMTATEFKASLSGKYLYYELETPIETIIDDYDLIDYEVSDFGTEEIIADEPTTPIIADIQYGFNAVDEIRNHRFKIKRLNKKIDELTALVESLLTTQDVNYEEID